MYAIDTITPQIFTAAMYFYVAAAFFYVVHAAFWPRGIAEVSGRVGLFTALTGFLLHTLTITFILWLKNASMTPDLIDSDLFFVSFTPWGIMLLGITFKIFGQRYNIKLLGALFTSLGFFSIAFTKTFAHSPLVPGGTVWLDLHAIVGSISGTAFFVSFVAAIVYLIKKKKRDNSELIGMLVQRDGLYDIHYSMIIIGFSFLTITIICISVWAHFAWGIFWSWSPKETWALLTWLLYCAVIAAKCALGWSGKRVAIMSITAFIVSISTYWASSFFLGGTVCYG